MYICNMYMYVCMYIYIYIHTHSHSHIQEGGGRVPVLAHAVESHFRERDRDPDMAPTWPRIEGLFCPVSLRHAQNLYRMCSLMEHSTTHRLCSLTEWVLSLSGTRKISIECVL
jgi:hypothetical protein